MEDKDKSSSNEIQNKVIRLFTYLEKVLSLDENTIRDFRQIAATPSPWWLADFPQDVENLKIKEFDTEKNASSNGPEADAWLSVEKKNTIPSPTLPKELEEWIEQISPLEPPKAKAKIDRTVQFDKDKNRVQKFRDFRKNFQQGQSVPEDMKDWVILNPSKLPEAIDSRYISDLWSDHPELQNMLKQYIETDWQPWSDKVKKIYKANMLYDELYALRIFLKNEGDNYELLWGHTLLIWKHPQVGTIYAPIFITPLTLNFDPAKRIIEISPDPIFKGFADISCLHNMEHPTEMDLITWADRINTNPFNFWHLETLKLQCRTLLNYISNESEDLFEDRIVSAPHVNNVVTIINAPVIFAKKRTNDLWAKYSSFIRRDIEQNHAEPTEFIYDLIGHEKKNKPEIQNQSVEVSKEYITEPELFFPLPWNDEQKRIADRLESHYGVVVKGPPGTGKSHTIANLISRLLAQGKTVLVTAQTSKALEVLRDKLPENIRILAVSQLHQTASRDEILQQSISEISSNLGERHTKFNDQRIELIREELQITRKEQAIIANKIRQYIIVDSSAKINIDGEEIKPIDAAKYINKNCSLLEWFTDHIEENTELNFNEDEIVELNTTLLSLSKEEKNLYQLNIPPLSVIPSQEDIKEKFLNYQILLKESSISAHFFENYEKKEDYEHFIVIKNLLEESIKILSNINSNYEQKIFDLCFSDQFEKEKWQSILCKVQDRIIDLGQNRNLLIGHEIIGEKHPILLDDLLEAIALLKEKAKNSEKLSAITKLLLPTNAKKVLEIYKINNRPPDCEERITLLQSKLNIEKAERDIKIIIDQSICQIDQNFKFSNDTVSLGKLVKSLERIVNYVINFSAIDEFFKKNKQISDFSSKNYNDVIKALELVNSHVAKLELAFLDKLFLTWSQEIENSVNNNHHPIVEKILNFLSYRISDHWNNITNELSELHNKKLLSTRANELTLKIKQTAPKLCDRIINASSEGKSFSCFGNLHLAWKVAKLECWLKKLHGDISIDELQTQLERLIRKEQQINSELVTILAWQRQIDRVTRKQRDALMAWAHEIKKYGKGTGKYAATHLSAAQEALKEAKNAVPVWIMPLQRAAQMFPEPKAGMFDVVIFDEASQCDIRGITIGYLGKKLLIVGDPEQISPAGIFQDQAKVFELISRFLHDIPYKDTFSVTSSLFDLAKIRLSNIIQLNEHFRCVPEIIAFSNYHIYEGKLKPLRYPHPKGLLKPALVPVFTDNGFENTNNRVNEPEANALVEKLIACLNDPNYQKRPNGKWCTFGIISLLGGDQVKYIETLIRNHIALGTLNEKIIEERKIDCGDAYRFQGDERDVIFLSMVRAPDRKNPRNTIISLTSEDAKQRFNVAASRAREQMFLFHSTHLEIFKNNNDWRYKLLNWFYNPQTEKLNAGREALKREFDNGKASIFSFEVGNLIIDRGYQVLPEYPIMGYRIDLVIQGEDARLAVECDGDQYHTLENFDEDQARERILRRAGWEFWRVTGSAFYKHKEKALESLWKKLDELGIQNIST